MGNYFTEEERARVKKGLGDDGFTRLSEGASQSGLDYIGGFVNSAVQAPFELFGMEAGADAQRYRDINPTAGFISQLLGSAVPYIGWGKAAKAIPMMERVLAGVAEKTVAKPFVGGMLKEAITYAPLEAAGILSTAVVNPDRLKDRVQEGFFNLGLGSIVGGFWQMGKAAGLADAGFTDLPGVDHHITVPTIKLRQVREAMVSGKYTPEQMEKASTFAKRMETAIRKEMPDRNSRYMTLRNDKTLATPEAREKAAGATVLDDMFRPGENATSRTSMLVNDGEHRYGSNAEIEHLLTKEVGPRALEHMQFPRVRTILDSAADMTEKEIKRLMVPGGDGLWWRQDGAEGLYMIAKKLAPRAKAAVDPLEASITAKAGLKATATIPTPQDRWLFFKTDKPELYSVSGSNWFRAAEKAWGPSDPIKWGEGTAGAHAQQWLENIPIRSEFLEADKGKVEAMLARLLNTRDTTKLPIYKQIARAARTYLMPGTHSFTSPRARRIYSAMESTNDIKNSMVNRLLRGGARINEGESPAVELWKMRMFGKQVVEPVTPGVPAVLGRAANTLPLEAGARVIDELGSFTLGSDGRELRPIFETLDSLANPRDRFDFNLAVNNAESIEYVRQAWQRGDISDAAYKALENMQRVDEAVMRSINHTLKNAGLPAVKPMEGHYMMARKWEGDWRIPLKDGENRIVYMFSGHNLKQAQDRAAKFMAKYGEMNLPKGWTLEPEMLRGDTPDIIFAAQHVDTENSAFRLAAGLDAHINRPTTLKERSDVGGYMGQDSGQTVAEMKETVTRHLNELAAFNYDVTMMTVLQKELAELAIENPWEAKQLMARYNVLMGRKEGFDKEINDFLDRTPLGTILGKGSATKIANSVNRFVYNMTLGMGNLQHPALTFIGAMQTLLPQVHYVMKARSDRIGKFYALHLLGDNAGNMRGGIGVLDSMKLVRQSMRAMGNPDASTRRAIESVANEGLLFAQMDQDMLGPASGYARGIKGAYEEGGLGEAITYVSEFAPRKSEDMTRLLSATMGSIVAKDLLRLPTQDAINRFTSQFVKHTMFSYGAWARPQMLQGPVGSMFGLFKNWSMNYMGWMLEYAGAAKEGNMAPLLWQLATTTAVAGVGGTAVVGLTDPFVRMATGKGSFEHIHAMFDDEDEAYSDGIWHGLPGLLGYTLQGSAAMPGADPARDASMLYSFAMWERMKSLGMAIGGVYDSVGATGRHPMDDPEVRSSIAKAFLPRSIIHALQLQGDGYIHSMNTGQPIAKVSPLQGVMYSLGFTPREVADSYEIAGELFSNKEKMSKALSIYAATIIDAQDAGDHAGATQVMKEAIGRGLQPDRILKSIQAKRERAAEGLVQSRMTPEMQKRFEGIVDRKPVKRPDEAPE